MLRINYGMREQKLSCIYFTPRGRKLLREMTGREKIFPQNKINKRLFSLGRPHSAHTHNNYSTVQ